MAPTVELQWAAEGPPLADEAQLSAWLARAFPDLSGSLLVRVVDEAEGAELNETYRHRTGPTNVLSFPFEVPPGVTSDHLGDLVICAPVVRREAARQSKPPKDHFAHLLIHGVLHLLGFDHTDDEKADEMEALEVKKLQKLGIPDPYNREM